MATITVCREYGALLGRMRGFVDGTVVTALRSNSCVEITTDAGWHTVRVVMAWQAGAPVDVGLGPGDGATLRARVDLRAHSLSAESDRRGEALGLDVVADRPPIPPAGTGQADIRRG